MVRHTQAQIPASLHELGTSDRCQTRAHEGYLASLKVKVVALELFTRLLLKIYSNMSGPSYSRSKIEPLKVSLKRESQPKELSPLLGNVPL